MNALRMYSKYSRLAMIAKKLSAIKCEAKWLSKAFDIWAKNFKNDFDFFGDSQKVDEKFLTRSVEIPITLVTGYCDKNYDRVSSEILVVNKNLNTQPLIQSCKSRNISCKEYCLESDNQGIATLFKEEETIQDSTLLLFRITFSDGKQAGCYLKVSKLGKKYRIRHTQKDAFAFYVSGNIELYNHTDSPILENDFGFIFNGFFFVDLDKEESRLEKENTARL